MAPSDGIVMPSSKVWLCYAVLSAFLCSNWVLADMSCMIGNLDTRELMKEYTCSDYANREEIERTHQEHAGAEPGHYSTVHHAGVKNTSSKEHLTFISPPNISVALLPKIEITHCYVFKYQLVKMREEKGDPLREVSIHANFSCDYQNLCQNQPLATGIQIRYNGIDGELFCCKEDNCNKEDAVRDIPPRQQLCYNASNDGTTKKAALDYCTRPDTRCARARRTDPGKEEELYFCDNLHHCQNHSLTVNDTAAEMCKMVNIGAKEIELCCCSRNKCYVPDWLNDKKTPVNGDSSSVSTASPGLSWMFIGGMILTALVSAAIISMIGMGIRHCRRGARDNIMTLTYTRLTVSVPEPGKEDVQMLLE